MVHGRTSRLLGVALLAMTISSPTAWGADPVWDKEPKGVNPATGAPANAPAGCCCIPVLHPTAAKAFDCKASMAQFDCTAECAQLKDGRDPSGCKWTKGECPR
jgi:hypothetical protein